MRHANGMPETPVVNCVLLWAGPGMEAALSAYEDEVLAWSLSTAAVSCSR
jgi:hypothetical protein